MLLLELCHLAFANAGVSLEGLTFKSLLNPVPLGIVAGLFLENKSGYLYFHLYQLN